MIVSESHTAYGSRTYCSRFIQGCPYKLPVGFPVRPGSLSGTDLLQQQQIRNLADLPLVFPLLSLQGFVFNSRQELHSTQFCLAREW